MIRLATVGTFGRINPFIVKGKNAEGLFLTFDTLYFQQPGTGRYYSLLADNIVFTDTSVTITLNPKARFHNGDFVTIQDFIETLEVLKRHGLPFYKYYLKYITVIKINDAYSVTLSLKMAPSQFFPFVASLPILSKKQLAHIKDFSNFQHCPLIGTGPYQIDSFHVGQNIVLKRNRYYWASGLNIRQGKFNFDKINIDYYKDYISLFESFKRGHFDIVFDTDPRHFLNTKFVHEGFEKLEFRYEYPYLSVQALMFNKDRSVLKYRQVREAIEMTFDFDTINLMFFENRLKRAYGIFNRVNTLPSHPLKTAEQLLEDAGFFYQKGFPYRVNKKGEALNLYVIIRRRRFEKVLNVFAEKLKRIGVQLNIVFLEENLYKLYEQKKEYDLLWLTINPEKNKIDTFVHQLSQFIPLDLIQQQNVEKIEQYLKDQKLLIFMDYSPYIWVMYRKDRIVFPTSIYTGINVMENGFAVK